MLVTTKDKLIEYLRQRNSEESKIIHISNYLKSFFDQEIKDRPVRIQEDLFEEIDLFFRSIDFSNHYWIYQKNTVSTQTNERTIIENLALSGSLQILRTDMRCYSSILLHLFHTCPPKNLCQLLSLYYNSCEMRWLVPESAAIHECLLSGNIEALVEYFPNAKDKREYAEKIVTLVIKKTKDSIPEKQVAIYYEKIFNLLWDSGILLESDDRSILLFKFIDSSIDQLPFYLHHDFIIDNDFKQIKEFNDELSHFYKNIFIKIKTLLPFLESDKNRGSYRNRSPYGIN